MKDINNIKINQQNFILFNDDDDELNEVDGISILKNNSKIYLQFIVNLKFVSEKVKINLIEKSNVEISEIKKRVFLAFKIDKMLQKKFEFFMDKIELDDEKVLECYLIVKK